MSIPLRAASCALAIALALVPGTAGAATTGPGRVPGERKGERAERKRALPGSRPVHPLAALQSAVRRKRAVLRAQWQDRALRAVGFAFRQRGRPYVWGGTGRSGFDCSGLVQQAWRSAGVSIPRVTTAQYARIRTKVARGRLRPGDLVFFNRLAHVGIYIGRGRFIHAPRPGRTVTTERLTGSYAQSYVGAVRPGWTPLPQIPAVLG